MYKNAESQVIGISGLRAVGYTLGFIMAADGFEPGPGLGNPDVLPISPWLKKDHFSWHSHLVFGIYL
jgi:hypothetical protein